MEIFVGSSQACDRKGAQEFITQITQKPDSILGLATGSTPIGIYRALVESHLKGEVSFKKVTTFNLDEYVGLPREHECSYYYFMRDNLFNHIDIRYDASYIPNGMASDLEQECRDYEEKIKSYGGIDLQILGIGHNGHIGFNEPGTPFDSVTHVVNLTQSTIDANSRFFASVDEVPRQALSMGIKTIMHARKIILVAKGADKADIIRKALQGPITPEVPASVLQLHPNVVVILDNEAASKLDK